MEIQAFAACLRGTTNRLCACNVYTFASLHGMSCLGISVLDKLSEPLSSAQMAEALMVHMSCVSLTCLAIAAAIIGPCCTCLEVFRALLVLQATSCTYASCHQTPLQLL